MAKEDKRGKPSESFGEMIKEFGDAVSKILTMFLPSVFIKFLA